MYDFYVNSKTCQFFLFYNFKFYNYNFFLQFLQRTVCQGQVLAPGIQFFVKIAKFGSHILMYLQRILVKLHIYFLHPT